MNTHSTTQRNANFSLSALQGISFFFYPFFFFFLPVSFTAFALQDDGDFEDVDDETKKFLLEWLKKRTADDVSTALFETVCRGVASTTRGRDRTEGGKGGRGEFSLSLAPCILGFFGRSPSPSPPSPLGKKGKKTHSLR